MTSSFPRVVVVGVALGLIGAAIVFWQRSSPAPSDSTAPAVPALPEPTDTAAALVTPPAPDLPLPKSPAENPVAPPVDGNRSSAFADRSNQPIPVIFHIRNRRDLQIIDGEVSNPTAQTLSITLLDVNSSTQAVSELQFVLAPGERKTYSTDGGFYMASGDELTVRSPPYQDKVVRVP